MSLAPADLARAVGSGLLSFPVTDFDEDGQFREASYRERLAWLAPYKPSALFAAGGTGEFFSLSPAECRTVVAAAVDQCRGQVPIIAGAGAGTSLATEYARNAEAAGADGLLLLPHYLTEAGQDGLFGHIRRICAATGLGVIVYNRASCRLLPDTLARLADACPNLVGFKDGIGDIELMMAIRLKLGDRLAYLGGLPTAEVYAPAYKAMGTPTYSSAVFNFIPATAVRFYEAMRDGDSAVTDQLLRDFFMPYLAIRNRRPGYAVSIIKAGARIVGHDAGPVRAPLVDLTPEEMEMLAALIARTGVS